MSSVYPLNDDDSDHDSYPAMPTDAAYASCYCEENVYLLAAQFATLARQPQLQRWSAYAVFISNQTRTVALWSQRAAREPNAPVVWDYHVVLALRPDRSVAAGAHEGGGAMPKRGGSEKGRRTMVYDADCALGAPLSWDDYVCATFALGDGLPPEYHSLFRVVPADIFLAEFVSDRSHMLLTRDGTDYSVPPPPWAPLHGHRAPAGVRTNLMDAFVSMDAQAQGFGSVYDLEGFMAWCVGNER